MERGREGEWEGEEGKGRRRGKKEKEGGREGGQKGVRRRRWRKGLDFFIATSLQVPSSVLNLSWVGAGPDSGPSYLEPGLLAKIQNL